MKIIDDRDETRTAQALAAMDGGEDAAWRRVWVRVQQGIQLDIRRRRRRAAMAAVAGALLTLVAAVAAVYAPLPAWTPALVVAG